MDFLCNPFYILNATSNDNKRRISDQEKKCILFAEDPVKVKKAAETLTKPLPRIYAEIAWMPLKNAQQAKEICELLETSKVNLGGLDNLRQIQDYLEVDDLMPIAKCNVLAAGMHYLPRHASDEVERWILELAWASEEIDAEQVRKEINADRKESGFPVVNLPHIKAEIQKLQKYYLRVITSVLKKLSGKKRAPAIKEVIESATDLIEGMRVITSIQVAMSGVVESTTDDEKQFPRLIDCLVDWYEVDAQNALEEHETRIKKLDKKLRLAADENHPDSVLASLVNQLTDAITNWHAVVHPIQVNKKIKGLRHKDSERVEGRVRRLALHLFHEYEKLTFCQQLIMTLQSVFADVVQISEDLAKDMNQLGDIARRRGRNAQESFKRIREERAREDIEMQVQKLRAAADAKKTSLGRMANRLIQSVRRWKPLAQPIRTSNSDCLYVANLVRELAVYLRNEHDNLNVSLQLLKTLQKEFAEIGEIANLVAELVKALEAPEHARLDVKKDIRKLRSAADAKKPDSILNPMVNQLIQSVKEWKALAQPFHSYRKDHKEVANLVRELSRHLWHEHGKISHTRKLMKMLQEVFAEIGEITRLVAEDMKTLDATENARLRIQTQVDTLRAAAAAKNSDSILAPMVNQLVQSVKDWKALAQPIDAYSTDYPNLVHIVVELAFRLRIAHGKVDFSRHLFKKLQEEFTEVRGYATSIAKYSNALEGVERALGRITIYDKELRVAAVAKRPDSDLGRMVNQLIQSAKEWKDRAQPIKAYYADHYSRGVHRVKRLALDLQNEHGNLDGSRKLFKTIRQEFAEFDQIARLVDKHLKALKAVERARRKIEIQVKELRVVVYATYFHPDLRPRVNRLIQSVNKWKDKAQSIKVYRKDSCNVAELVLKLAEDLRNKGKWASSRQLTKRLRVIFGEIPEIATLLDKDDKARDETEKKHTHRSAKKRTLETVVIPVIVIGSVVALLLVGLFLSR